MKVVSLDDSGSISICRNPELASNFVKYFAPPSWASVVSTEGKTCRSRHTLAFNLVKLTQILTFPFGFGTTTIPAHHSVGSVTSVITPILTIRSISSFTFGSSGTATRRGTERA